MHIHLCWHAAEDWLNPSVILEVFEARAIRMSIACAQDLSKFSNQEEGLCFYLFIFKFIVSILSLLLVLFMCFFFLMKTERFHEQFYTWDTL